MKLEAKQRLQAIQSIGPMPQSMLRMSQSVRQFFVEIANRTAGIRPMTGDCRSTVAKALRDNEHNQAEIIVVGLKPDHAIHTFTVNAEGEPLADAYKNKKYDPKTGIYTRVREGQEEGLDTLYRMPVHEFMTQWVEPRLNLPGPDARIDAYIAAHTRITSTLTEFHGHVIPRPDGCKVKCGGPNCKAWTCQVCAEETRLFEAGIHPLQRNPKCPT